MGLKWSVRSVGGVLGGGQVVFVRGGAQWASSGQWVGQSELTTTTVGCVPWEESSATACVVWVGCGVVVRLCL